MMAVIRNDIPIDLINEYLSYDSDSGIFRWKKSKGSSRAGSEAGCVSSLGYLIIKLNGTYYKAHRIAYALIHGISNTDSVDHINRVKTDNMISNLRISTASENSRNMTENRLSTTGKRGVTYHKRDKMYQASIRTGHKRIHLGYFMTLDEASMAYERAAKKYHLDFYYNKGWQK